jgi:hypothetical protein
VYYPCHGGTSISGPLCMCATNVMHCSVLAAGLEDFIRISLTATITRLFSTEDIVLIASLIRKSLGSYQEYPDKSEGKQGKKSVITSKKLAGFFIRNLVKLVNPVPAGWQHVLTILTI